jgi:hypothetical protein
MGIGSKPSLIDKSAMKKVLTRTLMMGLLWIPLCLVSVLSAQELEPAYGQGEWCKFRVHYGFVTAGFASIKVDAATLDNKPVYHVKGQGHTTGISKWFFYVEDYYQSYIDRETQMPLKFIRKINEGGYTKDVQIDFNREANTARIWNKENDVKVTAEITPLTQDLVSAFYYLRNNLDVDKIKIGETVDLEMFFDKEGYRFQMKFLGREVLKTRFGKVKTLKFRPYVEGGRVFKEKESVTVWVSDDKNKIPLLIKADLAVGSLKASLHEFKGLSHPFKILEL